LRLVDYSVAKPPGNREVSPVTLYNVRYNELS
jgi:hypothetical protein